MKNLQMPHSYISVSEEELRSISGGGPLGDALDLFFSNLRLDDLFFSGGLISLSFTFVPMLLIRDILHHVPLLVGKMEQVCDGIVGAHHEVEACLYHIEQQHGHKGERK